MINKKILITGGAGAIGSNLARKLSENNKVIIVDNLSSGYFKNIYLNGNTKFFDCDINDDLRHIFAKKIDIIFHLAAFFANQNSIEHPEKDLETNGKGTLRLLELAKRYEVDKFIYASSSCTIGEMPKTPYVATKFLGERYVNLYQYHKAMDTVILRYYNNYGPGEVPGIYRNVIPNFISRALRGEDLIITGDGRDTRDFTFVEDLITATILAAESDKTIGEVINIGTGHPTKIKILAEKIIEHTKSKSKIVFGERRSWDTTLNRCCNTLKMKELLDYLPSTPLDEGLPITIDWLKKRRT
jgi:nucleoside-diphosphate-sugar epimerase